MTLGDLQGNTRVRILGIQVDGDVGQRLLGIGLTEGAIVEVVRQAPLRDPLQIRCQGASYALRRQDARLIRVESLETSMPAVGAEVN